MNKFREMIRYLSQADPDFQQVVVVDGDFKLFTRAWCVAELAVAHDMGMAQHMKVPSVEVLEAHEQQLWGLRIQDMSASRPEDKEEILRSIEDVEAFNNALQQLLFQDLVSAFNTLDSEARARLGGQMLRWGRAIPPSLLQI